MTKMLTIRQSVKTSSFSVKNFSLSSVIRSSASGVIVIPSFRHRSYSPSYSLRDKSSCLPLHSSSVNKQLLSIPTDFNEDKIFPKITRFLSSSPVPELKTWDQVNYPSFKASELEVRTCSESERKPIPPADKLIFGQTFTDHMLEIPWSERRGWGKPVISPLHNLSLHPSAKGLHYAQQLFEGMKGFRCLDGKIRLFRPDMNMKRMKATAERTGFPPFDGEELIECMLELIKIDKDWVPSSKNASLYIRPTLIGTEGTLGVAAAKEALLYVILSPVSGYFASGKIKPIKLIADPNHIRAWPGGVGDKKMGSNYGPTILIQKNAESKGFHQILWLFGEDKQLTEVGTMNIFVYLKDDKTGRNQLITPPLTAGLILPGVTRYSILDITRKWQADHVLDNFEVIERTITMGEVIKSLDEGRLMEVFGAGTACVVSAVEMISYEGNPLVLPPVTKSSLSQKILKSLTDIQYGIVSPHPWMRDVC